MEHTIQETVSLMINVLINVTDFAKSENSRAYKFLIDIFFFKTSKGIYNCYRIAIGYRKN